MIILKTIGLGILILIAFLIWAFATNDYGK